MPFEIPVPQPLISFFQGGGMRNLLVLEEKYGQGLSLFNAIRKAYPNAPGVPNDYYVSLVSYLYNFTKAALQGGDYIQTLLNRQAIDNAQLARNMYIRRPNDIFSNNMFWVQYVTLNPDTGQTHTIYHAFFEDRYKTREELLRRLTARIQEELDAVSVSARASSRYQIVPGSLTIIAGVRMV